MSKSIILSIKPKYVKKILSGKKKYEFRRVVPKKKIDNIYIYASYPICKVVAKVTMTRIITAEHCVLWDVTKERCGITREEYDKYFIGCEMNNAFCLNMFYEYDTPKSLSDFGIKRAPQNFAYVEKQYDKD